MLQHKTGFSNDLIGAGGATTGAIMGLAKASSAAIGIVAAGFGFAGTLVTSFDKRALITPYPEETKTLIIGALNKYRAAYPPAAMTEPAEAIANVQRYAELCTYSGITRAAKEALASAKGDVVSPAGADTQTLGAAISAELEQDPALSDAQLVALYWLINKGGAPCSPDASCKQALALLPDAVQDKIYDRTTKTYRDLTPLKNKVGTELAQLYASNSDFKADVVAFPSKPAAPAAKPSPAKPAPGKSKTAPAPANAKAPVTAVETYQYTAPGPKNVPVSSRAEKFGQFDFSGKPQETVPDAAPNLPPK